MSVPGTRQRLVVPVLVLAGVLVSVQATILVPVLSQLPEVYGVGSVAASWLVTGTVMTGALATPIVSRMADLYGKRRMLLLALAATVVGSLLLALTHDFTLALVGRALQGFGSSLMPVAMSVIKDLLPADRVAPAVALVSSTLGIGAALGLPIAGALYSGLGWSALFWMTAIIGTVVSVAIRLVLPPARAHGPSRGWFDWLGAVLLLVALLPLLLVLTQGNGWGWTSPAVVGMLGLAVVAAALWVLWERRSRDPLVDIALAVKRPVLLTNVASLLIAMGMFVNLLITSEQLGNPAAAGGFALAAGLVGLCAAVPAAVQVLAAPLVGRLLARFGGQRMFLVGALWMSASYYVRLLFGGSVVTVVLGAVLVTLGSGLTLSSLTVVIMENVPRERTASANGLNALCRTIGSSVATASLAAVTALTAVDVGGLELASPLTHRLVFVGCGTAALLSAAIMLFSRRGGEVRTDARTAAVASVEPAGAADVR